MNRNIRDAVGLIGDDLISAADESNIKENFKPQKRRWLKYTGIAACFISVICAAVAVILIINNVDNHEPSDNQLNKQANKKTEYVFENYSMNLTDDGWRMSINVPVQEADNEPSLQMKNSLDYATLDELLDKIANGTFTEQEIRFMNTVFPKDEKGIKIFDINYRIDAVLPEGYEITSVIWKGESYSYSFHKPGSERDFGYLIWTPDQYFQSVFDHYYTNEFEAKGTTMKSITERENGETEYLFDYPNSSCKGIRYNISDDIMVTERYILDLPDFPDEFVSETVPASVKVFHLEDDFKWHIFYYSDERPSRDKLMEFRLVKSENGLLNN